MYNLFFLITNWLLPKGLNSSGHVAIVKNNNVFLKHVPTESSVRIFRTFFLTEDDRRFCPNMFLKNVALFQKNGFYCSAFIKPQMYLVAFKLSPRGFMGQFRTFPLCFHFSKFSFQALDTPFVALGRGTKLGKRKPSEKITGERTSLVTSCAIST